MSANNYIYIQKDPVDGSFHIEDRNADGGETNSLIGVTETLEDAIKLAYKYREDCEVEYGLEISL